MVVMHRHMIYCHTQRGTLTTAALGAGLCLTVSLTLLLGFNPIAAGVSAMLAAFLVMFTSLTVEIDSERLSIRFGPGPIGKRFRLSEIASATAVRNHWYYGWGIRLTPRGWLFNVSGLDAVEMTLKNGKVFRIGTDEPVKLLNAIQSHVKAS